MTPRPFEYSRVWSGKLVSVEGNDGKETARVVILGVSFGKLYGFSLEGVPWSFEMCGLPGLPPWCKVIEPDDMQQYGTPGEDH